MQKRHKPDKFPLHLHATGQWAKKIRGKRYYFGTDRDAALKEFVRVKEDLEGGRLPRPKQEHSLTVRQLANTYLTARRLDVDCGELNSRTWGEYHKVCERMIDVFKPEHVIDDLRPEDFGRLKATAAKTLGPVALSRMIQFTRTIFSFAFESEFIDRPVRFGPQFERPPKRVIRLAKIAAGEKLIDAADARKMIEAAEPQLRAIILLGLNCGFGQADCSALNRTQFAKRPGWIAAPRAKPAIARRCPLWPETQAAIEAVEAIRPVPRDEADSDAVFLTRQGVRWVRWIDAGDQKVGTRRDTAAEAFGRLAKELNLAVPGGPYVLRHTFRTVCDEIHDTPAINLIMGHGDHTMASHYREKINDERLLAVVGHVRKWLFYQFVN